jgi:uncharacterized protein (DUF433 family)
LTFIEKYSIIKTSIDAVKAKQRKAGNIMQGHIPRKLAERIVCDEDILTGKPVIKGTRLAVEFIVGLLGHGWTEAEILENYPHIVQADIRACLAYASAVLRTQKDYQHPMKLTDASISR